MSVGFILRQKKLSVGSPRKAKKSTDEKCMRISQERADTVTNFIVAAGVPVLLIEYDTVTKFIVAGVPVLLIEYVQLTNCAADS
jgi:hypothetical protein